MDRRAWARRRDRDRGARATGQPCRSSRCAAASSVDRHAFTLENVAGQDAGRPPRGVLRRALRLAGARCRRRSSPDGERGRREALEELLTERRGSRVEMRRAERGEKRRLAGARAAERAARALGRSGGERARSGSAASGRSRSCGRPSTSRCCRLRIECYDISNIQGHGGRWPRWSSSSTAMPKKARLPHLRHDAGSTGQDDFASMAEAISRRFARLGVSATRTTTSFAACARPRRDRRRQGAAQRPRSPRWQRTTSPRVAAIGLAKRRGGDLRARPVRRRSCSTARVRPAAAAPHPRRGAPLRARLPPPAARGRRSASLFDTLPGVGPARKRALLRALRLAGRDARRLAGGARGRPGLPPDRALDLRAPPRAGRGSRRASLIRGGIAASS